MLATSLFSDYLADGANLITILGAVCGVGFWFRRRQVSKPTRED
ncbi:hypothetical protein [Mesorhizobium sp. B2-3-4]|nr:hypothetical protein [Mesorhizobium sp. B2-3-4]